MSYSTLFGAIAVPADAVDPYGYTSESAPQFGGSSRGGWFQATSRHLLDALPGHEALRFLSAETATREVKDDGGRTVWTLLGGQAAAAALVDLEALIRACGEQPQKLAEEVFRGYGTAGAAEIAGALRRAGDYRELNREAPHGEDGDSVEFFFSVFVSLRAILRNAAQSSRTVVFFSWLPF